MWFSMLLAMVTVSVLLHLLCLDDITLGLGDRVTTFWEGPSHSVNHTFGLLCLFVDFVVFHLGFEYENSILIASVPGHCCPFNFEASSI